MLIALIVVGIRSLTVAPGVGSVELLTLQAAQLIPLAIVLSVFIVALRLVIPGRTRK